MFRQRNILMVVIVLCVGAWSAGSGLAQVRILYVDDSSAAGLDNGTDWDNAFVYLQDALGQAANYGCIAEIRVAGGTYRPDERSDWPVGGSGDRTAAFQLVNGVRVSGGYAGYGAPDPDQRDIPAYETILSGDLDGNDGAGFTNNEENSFHVVIGSDTDETAVLDGFSITAGNADESSPPNNRGGGMVIINGSPTLANCTFHSNSTERFGGGMYFSGGYPTLTDCTFSGNSAAHHDGGGMYSSGNATLHRCTFTGNFSGGGDGGGGMFSMGGNLVLDDCTFIGNSTVQRGGGLIVLLLGGSGHVTLANCTFIGNSAVREGGGLSMLNFQGTHNLTLINCAFSGNSAEVGGGGLCIYNYMDGGNLTLTNCTLSANSAPNGRALFCDSYQQQIPGTVQITNSVLWDGGDEIESTDGSTVTVNCSAVQGGWPGIGNIAVDPLLVDPDGPDDIVGTGDDNLRLLPESLCIDAGGNNALPPGITTDRDDNPRFVDALWIEPDPGCCTKPIVDMGAYEVQDCNGNGVPDGQDLALSQTILAADFESGLPGGWFASGLWHVTDACIVANECDPSHWVYFGLDAACNFDIGAAVQGILTAPEVLIPADATGAELTYCSAYHGEGGEAPFGFDMAWVAVNDSILDDVGFTTVVHNQWSTRTVDLSGYVGQTVTIIWSFNSVDDRQNDTLGWQVDAIELAAYGMIDNDCNTNGVPDECDPDCNLNGSPDECDIDAGTSSDCDHNGVPDECEADFDGDGLIDSCDPDIDGDGVPNDNDVCDYTPPGLPPELIEPDGSVLGDLDGDCDVDLDDFALMQARFTGPNQ